MYIIYIFIVFEVQLLLFLLVGFLGKYRRNAERAGTGSHKVSPEELPYDRLL